jgi:hypothetical protein
MNNQPISSSTQHITIQLEVVPEDEQQRDIADIDEVGRSLFEQLRSTGYMVTPTSTGKKGGGPIFNILIQFPQFLHDNKDWLLGSIPPLLECLLIVRDKHVEREGTKRAPLKVTLKIDGKPLTIETTDPKDAAKLLERLQITYPKETSKVTPKSKIEVRVNVPKKKRRG